MVSRAARISHGWLASDFWNTLAVPAKPPWMVFGTPSRAIASSIARVPSDSGTPAGRLKEMVVAANSRS